MPTRFRYSQWDGTQDIPALDADDILQSLSDDLLSFGDLQQALRNMMQRGIRTPDGERTDGMRDLLQRLRQQRRQQLERFDLSSVFDDIQRQLDEILDMERDTLDDRLDEVGPRPEPQQATDEQQDFAPPDGGSSREAGEGGEQDSGQQSSQQQQASPLTEDEMDRLKEALRQRLERKQEQIDRLPEDAAGQVKELQEYEFEDDEAREKYEELLEQLKQSMMNRFFQDMSQMMSDMSPEDMDQMREMMQDLNEMLERQRRGEDPRFDEFMDKWGDMFGDDPPQSLDELVEQMQRQAAQMQNLMSSLPGEMRQQLGDMMQQLMGDMGMDQELAQLAQNLEALYPMRDMLNQYPFRGQEEIDLQAAMSLMGDMQQLDELERALERVQYGGNIDDIDPDQLEELMGEEAVKSSNSSRTCSSSSKRPATSRRRATPGNSPLAATDASARRPWPRSTPTSSARTSASTTSRDRPLRRPRRRQQTLRVRRPIPSQPQGNHLQRHPAHINRFTSPLSGGRCRRQRGALPDQPLPRRLRGLPLRDPHPDRDRGHARPLLVHGPPRIIPGGQEGRHGAQQPDPHAVPRDSST